MQSVIEYEPFTLNGLESIYLPDSNELNLIFHDYLQLRILKILTLQSTVFDFYKFDNPIVLFQ